MSIEAQTRGYWRSKGRRVVTNSKPVRIEHGEELFWVTQTYEHCDVPMAPKGRDSVMEDMLSFGENHSTFDIDDPINEFGDF